MAPGLTWRKDYVNTHKTTRGEDFEIKKKPGARLGCRSHLGEAFIFILCNNHGSKTKRTPQSEVRA